MQTYRQKPEHKEYVKAYNKAYREKNREKLQEANRSWKQANRTRTKLLNKQERYRLKLEVLSHYSKSEQPSCTKCRFTDIRALQLDHLEDNGASSRIAVSGVRTGAGTTYYRWIRKNNFPEGYQVLCSNCNVIKFQEAIDAYYPDSIQL